MSAGFSIKFWGVRGSVPAPGASTVTYGGNTTCIEVRAGGRLIIMDAGTGIRHLGKALNKAGTRAPKEITLLLTHTHWDHIQGLPFFLPQLRPGSRLKILGCEGAREGLATLLARQMESPFFPIPLRRTPANIIIEELKEAEFSLGRVQCRTLQANHPGTCIGYKLTFDGKTMAFFPDNEPYLGKLRAPKGKASADDTRRAHQGHSTMVEFLKGVHTLVMDAQYDATEYPAHIGWGHGCVDDVVALAIEAGVAQLVLFHHDPDHSDAKLTQMARYARGLVKSAKSRLRIETAREGALLQVGYSHV